MSVSRFSQSSLQNGFEKFNTIWDGKTAVGSMEAISSVTLSSTLGSVSFNNIPQTYQHLELRTMALGSSSNQDILIRFGSSSTIDSGSNYSWHELRGTGTNPVSSTATPNASALYVSSNAIDSAFPDISILSIVDYSNINKYKTLRVLRGGDRNGSGTMGIFSGNWRSFNAIDSLLIYVSGGSFNANSTFSLYGIK
jgi:hypothetical protein